MTKKRGLAGVFILLMLATLAACGGGGGGGTPPPTAAAITAQPTDQSAVAGAAATFTVAASNATGYLWQRSTDGGASFTNMNAATNASHTTAASTLPDSGTKYRVVVAGAGNSVTSSAATLTVTAAVVPPSISVQPAAQTITAGQNASFSVTAAGTALTYQWQRSTDGGASFAPLAGASNATLTLTAVAQADNAQQFRVVVSNSAGSITSSAALLTVNVAPIAAAITTQPVSVTVVAPNTATFTAAATGTPSPTLQWQSSTNGGTSFADIAGATGSSYSTTATVVGDSGRQYRLIATNGSGSATSNAALLTVTAAPQAPAITTQPASQSVTAPASASFTVAASGVPTPALQWQLSSDAGATWANITGAVAASYITPATVVGDSGKRYRATASNASGSATSAAALLTVNPAPALSRIIFSRNNGTVNAEQYDLYSIYEDGTGEIQLTNAIGNEHVVAIAPGGRVIYQRTTGGQTDLYSVNADGTGTATLANTADFEIFAGITPSGRVIYRRDSAATGRDLYSVNADGSGAVALANTAGNDDFAGITPSGKVIYTVAGDLYSINADGTGKVALGADPAFYEDFKGVTPSGLVIVGTVDSNFFGSGSIYSISENGGTATTLATNTLAFEYDVASNGGVTASGVVVINRTLGLGLRDIYGSLGGGFVALATSPDYEQFYFATASGQIVYVRNPTTTRRDIYIVNADGSATTLLANSAANNNNFPVNVTSNKLIYASGSGSSSTNIGDLYSVNLDGTGTVPLANTVDYEEFKGITSGGRVIYQRTDSSNITYLYAVNIDGTGTTPLANSGGHALFVATTPSGKVLFRRQPGNADLYIVNADGTGMTPLANTGNDEFFEAIVP